MLAFLISTMMFGYNPSVLSVPTYDAKEAWIDQLAECESNASTTIKILDTNGYYSYGLLMFQQKTWLHYGKSFGATKENIFDGNLQRKVARSMLDEKLWRHWFNCGKIVQKSLGEYPF